MASEERAYLGGRLQALVSAARGLSGGMAGQLLPCVAARQRQTI